MSVLQVIVVVGRLANGCAEFWKVVVVGGSLVVEKSSVNWSLDCAGTFSERVTRRRW